VLAVLAAACPAARGEGEAVVAARQAAAVLARPVASAEQRQRQVRLAAQWALSATGLYYEEPEPSADDWAEVGAVLSAVSQAARPACQVLGVPYVPQIHASLCAPACVQMALAFLGIQTSQAELLCIAGPSPETYGVHVTQIGAIASHFGAEAISGEGSVELLRCGIAAGFPVLVYQYAGKENDVEHMRVVTGFDDGAGVYRSLDPSADLGPELEIAYATFDELWRVPWREDGMGRWLCIIYPPQGRDTR
jgi:hypothetical protein